MDTKKELIIVFVRNPELGKVKTRLAHSIGNQKALDVYKCLLKHTHNVLSNCNHNCAFFNDQIDNNDLWNKKCLKSLFKKEIHLVKK